MGYVTVGYGMDVDRLAAVKGTSPYYPQNQDNSTTYAWDTVQSWRLTVKYRTRGNELILDNGTVVTFDLPIGKAIDVAGVIVVMLDVPPRQVFTENVFGVSSEGKIIWQIERIPEAATTVCRYMDLNERLPDTFLSQLEESHPEWKGLSQYVPGTFFAGNWGGAEAIVDARTGKVLRTFGSR